MPCKARAKPLKKSPKTTKKPAKRAKMRRKRLRPRTVEPKAPTSQANPTKAQVKRGRVRAKSHILEPKAGSPEFKALQETWYNRLAQDGFIDLETLNRADGLDGLLNNRGSQAPARLAMAWNTEKETYFRRLTNYITHNPNWAGHKGHNLIGALFIQGISYRKMLPKLQAIGYKTNIWRVHTIVKRLEAAAKAWNRLHPEGLDFQADVG